MDDRGVRPPARASSGSADKLPKALQAPEVEHELEYREEQGLPASMPASESYRRNEPVVPEDKVDSAALEESHDARHHQEMVWREQLWESRPTKRQWHSNTVAFRGMKRVLTNHRFRRDSSRRGGTQINIMMRLQRLLDWMERYHGRIKLIWLLIAVVGFVLFAIGSYFVNRTYKFSVLWYSDIITGALYSLMFILEMCRAGAGKREKSNYITSFQGMVDLLNALMFLLPFIALGSSPAGRRRIKRFNAAFNFIRAARLQRPFWAVYSAYHQLPDPAVQNTKEARIYKFGALFGMAVVIILIFASYLLVFAQLVPEAVGLTDSEGNPFQFHDSVYLTVVTMSTVGYGDITPTAPLGQILIILLICIGIGIFSTVVSEVIAFVAFRSRYSGSMSRPRQNIFTGQKLNKSHIVVVGDLQPSKVRRFLQEFYHPDHGDLSSVSAVMMGPDEPGDDLKQLLAERAFFRHARYFQGLPSQDPDLKRILLTEASAVFVLTDPFSPKAAEGLDVNSLFLAVAAKKHCPTVPVYLQLALPRYRHLASLTENPPDQLICVEEFKANMLASNAICPGIIAMVHSLLSSSAPDFKELASLGDKGDTAEWRIAYSRGVNEELYRSPLPLQLVNMTLTEAALACFKTAETCLFAIGTCNEDDVEDIIMFPADGYRLRQGDMGYFIAESVGDIEKLKDMLTPDVLKQVQQTTDENGPLVKSLESGADFVMRFNCVARGPSAAGDEVLDDVDEASTRIEGHILVCGVPAALREFLQTLRGLEDKETQLLLPVVFLSKKIPEDAASMLDEFPGCQFLEGNPLRFVDLERARAGHASNIIIIAAFPEPGDGISDDDIDNTALLTYMELQAYLKLRINDFKGSVTIELCSPPNIKYLTSAMAYSADTSIPFTMNALFAAGMVYSNYTTDALLCQTFYNHHLNTILRVLLGLDLATLPKESERNGDDVLESRIRQVVLPSELRNRLKAGTGNPVTYGDLFEYLTLRSIMPFGLYRLATAVSDASVRGVACFNHESCVRASLTQIKQFLADHVGVRCSGEWIGENKRLPYVSTNPEPSTVLAEDDRVFVLASRRVTYHGRK